MSYNACVRPIGSTQALYCVDSQSVESVLERTASSHLEVAVYLPALSVQYHHRGCASHLLEIGRNGRKTVEYHLVEVEFII